MMSFLNRLRYNTPNTRECWNYRFELTADHLSQEDSEPLKHTWDTLGDAALERINEILPPEADGIPRNSARSSSSSSDVEVSPKRDVFKVLQENFSSDLILSKLWEQANTVPGWVDWDQIERGQEVFYRYSGASLNGLAYQSLLGGMGAARVVEVLARTGGFGTKVARHRLYETTQHVLQCTRDLQSLQPGGDGWASSIRVRLLHAAVRKRILKLAETRPQYYSVEKLGVPINDLDSIGTITSFSAALIWVALPRQGIYLRKQEIHDYMALWRYIAYLLGTPTDMFSTPEKAKAVLESLLLNEINPSQTSVILSRNIIEALSMTPPAYMSREFLHANARWLLGNELCDRLGLGRPPLYYWLLVAGQCIFFMALCYTYRSFESLDKWKISHMRDILWKVVVDSDFGLNGEAAVFNFRYVPEDTKTTVFEPSGRSGALPKGVERRNLKALIIFGTVVLSSTWVGAKLFGVAWRAIPTLT